MITKENILEKELKEVNRRMFNTSMKTVMLFIFLFVEVFIVGSFMIKSRIIENPMDKDKNYIAVIDLDQEITTKYIHSIMNKIEVNAKKDNVKEFLIIVNSPGGSPSASDELSEYLKYVNKNKKVTIYVESMAASGAYYIASAIKPLYANKNAIVGSIGVIMPHYNIGGLAKKLGIEEDYIAAGKFKKPVSLFKEIDSENKEYLIKNMVKPTYENFIASVAANRGLSIKKIKEFAEGTIYIANDPRIKGILIDKITNLYLVKQEIKDRYKDIHFKNITEVKNKGLFPLNAKVNFNLNDSTLLK